MRYMLTFYAIEDEWMALLQSEREAGIADIGKWFAEHAGSGRIVEGHRLGRGSEAKESVGSYAVVDVKDEDEAIAIAKRWPGGGAVEVRPVAD